MRVPCRTLQKRSGECGPGPAFLWLEFWTLLVRCKPRFAGSGSGPVLSLRHLLSPHLCLFLCTWRWCGGLYCLCCDLTRPLCVLQRWRRRWLAGKAGRSSSSRGF